MEQDKLIYLCKPNNRKYTQLNGIRRESVSVTKNLKDYSSISFEVDKDIVINGKRIPSNGYNDLHLDMEKLLLYHGDMIIFMKIQILLEMVSQYQNVVLIVLQFLI